jgi:hypothetical protein
VVVGFDLVAVEPLPDTLVDLEEARVGPYRGGATGASERGLDGGGRLAGALQR